LTDSYSFQKKDGDTILDNDVNSTEDKDINSKQLVNTTSKFDRDNNLVEAKLVGAASI